MCGHERVRGGERDGIDAPEGFPADEPRHDVAEGVGDERHREHRFDLAVLRVPAHDPGRLDRRGHVREVVRDHLVPVELRYRQLAVVEARVGEVGYGGIDDGRRHVDRGDSRTFLVGAHARTIPTDRGAGRIRGRSPTAVGYGFDVVGVGAAVVTGAAEVGGEVGGGAVDPTVVGAWVGGVVGCGAAVVFDTEGAVVPEYWFCDGR